MPGLPISLHVTRAALDALDPDAYPDGQRFVVTDEGYAEWEAVGPDGSRTLVALGAGAVTLAELEDVDVVTRAPVPGETLVWNGTHWIPGAGGGGEVLVADGVSPPDSLTNEAGTDYLYVG